MTGKMEKIGIIGPSPRFLSGISYYTTRLANAISDHCEVSAVLFRNMLPKRLFPGWKRVGSQISTLSYDKRVAVNEVLDWYNPISWVKASKELNSCDVVIFEWWTSSVAHMYVALNLLLGNGPKKIIEYHEIIDPLEQMVFPLKIYARNVGKWIRNRADGYVVHSEADRELIAEYYNIDKSKIKVIHHGLYDHYPIFESGKAKAEMGIRENEFIVLFFGLLRPYKGVFLLIDAFESLPEQIRNNCRLFIVGESWEDKKSLQKASLSSYAERITVIDRYVSDDEIPKFFSAADVLVLPYTRASQSGVAHIGIAYGMPIIASDVGGLSESLGTYDGTLFIPPNDSAALIKAITEVFSEKRKDFTIPKELSWEHISTEWMHLFQNLEK